MQSPRAYTLTEWTLPKRQSRKHDDYLVLLLSVRQNLQAEMDIYAVQGECLSSRTLKGRSAIVCGE